LERGRFGWFNSTEKGRMITIRELKWLLSGIDFRNKHEEINFLQDK
jgi:hypothetical protein